MTTDELNRFFSLRLKVFQAIKRELEIDSHCKSYEGAMSIQFPDYFEVLNRTENYIIELHCYVIGPSRHYSWSGKTLTKALDEAEKDILSWISEKEEV
jgi:hypothetical protein